MKESILFTAESEKTLEEFIESLKKNAPSYNFTLRHVLDMTEEYRQHGVDVEEGFHLLQVIVCNFERSYPTVLKDPKRAAVILPPKQMAVYRRDGKTIIHYMPFTSDIIARALPEDPMLQDRLAKACRNIIELIKASC